MSYVVLPFAAFETVVYLLGEKNVTNSQFASNFHFTACLLLLASLMMFITSWQMRHAQNKPDLSNAFSLMAAGLVVAAAEVWIAGNSIYVSQSERPHRLVLALLMLCVVIFSAAAAALYRATRLLQKPVVKPSSQG